MNPSPLSSFVTTSTDTKEVEAWIVIEPDLENYDEMVSLYFSDLVLSSDLPIFQKIKEFECTIKWHQFIQYFHDELQKNSHPSSIILRGSRAKKCRFPGQPEATDIDLVATIEPYDDPKSVIKVVTKFIHKQVIPHLQQFCVQKISQEFKEKIVDSFLQNKVGRKREDNTQNLCLGPQLDLLITHKGQLKTSFQSPQNCWFYDPAKAIFVAPSCFGDKKTLLQGIHNSEITEYPLNLIEQLDNFLLFHFLLLKMVGVKVPDDVFGKAQITLFERLSKKSDEMAHNKIQNLFQKFCKKKLNYDLEQLKGMGDAQLIYLVTAFINNENPLAKKHSKLKKYQSLLLTHIKSLITKILSAEKPSNRFAPLLARKIVEDGTTKHLEIRILFSSMIRYQDCRQDKEKPFRLSSNPELIGISLEERGDHDQWLIEVGNTGHSWRINVPLSKSLIDKTNLKNVEAFKELSKSISGTQEDLDLKNIKELTTETKKIQAAVDILCKQAPDELFSSYQMPPQVSIAQFCKPLVDLLAMVSRIPSLNTELYLQGSRLILTLLTSLNPKDAEIQKLQNNYLDKCAKLFVNDQTILSKMRLGSLSTCEMALEISLRLVHLKCTPQQIEESLKQLLPSLIKGKDELSELEKHRLFCSLKLLLLQSSQSLSCLIMTAPLLCDLNPKETPLKEHSTLTIEKMIEQQGFQEKKLTQTLREENLLSHNLSVEEVRCLLTLITKILPIRNEIHFSSILTSILTFSLSDSHAEIGLGIISCANKHAWSSNDILEKLLSKWQESVRRAVQKQKLTQAELISRFLTTLTEIGRFEHLEVTNWIVTLRLQATPDNDYLSIIHKHSCNTQEELFEIFQSNLTLIEWKNNLNPTLFKFPDKPESPLFLLLQEITYQMILCPHWDDAQFIHDLIGKFLEFDKKLNGITCTQLLRTALTLQKIGTLQHLVKLSLEKAPTYQTYDIIHNFITILPVEELERVLPTLVRAILSNKELKNLAHNKIDIQDQLLKDFRTIDRRDPKNIKLTTDSFNLLLRLYFEKLYVEKSQERSFQRFFKSNIENLQIIDYNDFLFLTEKFIYQKRVLSSLNSEQKSSLLKLFLNTINHFKDQIDLTENKPLEVILPLIELSETHSTEDSGVIKNNILTTLEVYYKIFLEMKKVQQMGVVCKRLVDDCKKNPMKNSVIYICLHFCQQKINDLILQKDKPNSTIMHSHMLDMVQKGIVNQHDDDTMTAPLLLILEYSMERFPILESSRDPRFPLLMSLADTSLENHKLFAPALLQKYAELLIIMIDQVLKDKEITPIFEKCEKLTLTLCKSLVYIGFSTGLHRSFKTSDALLTQYRKLFSKRYPKPTKGDIKPLTDFIYTIVEGMTHSFINETKGQWYSTRLSLFHENTSYANALQTLLPKEERTESIVGLSQDRYFELYIYVYKTADKWYNEWLKLASKEDKDFQTRDLLFNILFSKLQIHQEPLHKSGYTLSFKEKEILNTLTKIKSQHPVKDDYSYGLRFDFVYHQLFVAKVKPDAVKGHLLEMNFDFLMQNQRHKALNSLTWLITGLYFSPQKELQKLGCDILLNQGDYEDLLDKYHLTNSEITHLVERTVAALLDNPSLENHTKALEIIYVHLIQSEKSKSDLIDLLNQLLNSLACSTIGNYERNQMACERNVIKFYLLLIYNLKYRDCLDSDEEKLSKVPLLVEVLRKLEKAQQSFSPNITPNGPDILFRNTFDKVFAFFLYSVITNGDMSKDDLRINNIELAKRIFIEVKMLNYINNPDLLFRLTFIKQISKEIEHLNSKDKMQIETLLEFWLKLFNDVKECLDNPVMIKSMIEKLLLNKV